jgi:hypothetical protein
MQIIWKRIEVPGMAWYSHESYLWIKYAERLLRAGESVLCPCVHFVAHQEAPYLIMEMQIGILPGAGTVALQEIASKQGIRSWSILCVTTARRSKFGARRPWFSSALVA